MLMPFGRPPPGFPGGDVEYAATIAQNHSTSANKGPGGVGQKTPTVLFNGMIAPLIPFAIKGVIWYQGEDNADDNNGGGPGTGMEYRTLFPAMIAGWRMLWNQGDFPFLFVQLTNLANRPKAKWSLVRESQLKALSASNTGMAVIIDIGAPRNIHPPDKADVGYRLSLAARRVAYGEDLVSYGPYYRGIKVEGNKIRVSFQDDSVGGGLVIGSAPWAEPNAAPVSKTELQGFAIAGEDRKWTAADAEIDGKSVVVSSSRVLVPIAVRYAWADNPTCNFYNKEGLPASPFPER